ncbi:MAG: DUF3592 domain-containing protein [Desulfuromonas sp.]|nr:DUF3592 domain-containing protein [Desulfuromonas sp.]
MQTLFSNIKKVRLLPILLVLASGVIIGVYALLNVYWGYESQNWPTTEGLIIDSRIAGSTRIIGRKAFLKYEYYVDGVPYISRIVSYTWKCVDYQGSIDILREYPEGKRALVYYDPENPHNAVLKTEISGRILWLFLLSAMTILIGLRGLQWKLGKEGPPQ